MLIRAVLAAALIGIAAPVAAEPENANWPNYQEADFIIKDYRFASGETLPQLKLHYRTLGSAVRNAAGEIINGVLLLQGNTGTGANWLRPTLADELFKAGQPLDVERYFIIIPDALGRGGSSKPSDGLKGSFPHYRYHDMVESRPDGWDRRALLPACRNQRPQLDHAPRRGRDNPARSGLEERQL
jgi:homoserine O-acetyltransferase